MSGTVDIRRVLLAVMATAALVVVLAVPYRAQAASDCSSAGTDPTAAQYCPPTEPEEAEHPAEPKEAEHRQEECTEGNSGNTGSSGNSGSESGSEDCTEAVTTSSTPSAPAPAASEGGSLPFTGEELPTLLGIAAAFIAAGIALQRLSRPRAERN